MARFIPPRHYRRYLQYHYLPYEQVPEQEWDALRQKITDRFCPKQPLVSVVIIVYNEQDYILATLASLADMEPDFPTEIVMVNNNSDDATAKFLERSGVRHIFQPTPGIPETRQAGLEVARGKYVITGDADTIYRKEWVNELVKPLQKPEVVCTFSMYVFYTENNKYGAGHVLYHWAKYLSIRLKNTRRPHLNAMGGSMAFCKSDTERFGGYNMEMRRGSDGHLAWRLSELGQVKFIDRKKADVYSNMRRTLKDGTLMQAFAKRARKQLRYFFHYFTTQKES